MAEKTKEQIEREAYNKAAKDGGYFHPESMPSNYRPDLDPGQPEPETKSTPTDHSE